MSERKRCETLRVSLGRKSHTTVTRVSFHDVVLRPGRGEVETTDVESEKKVPILYCIGVVHARVGQILLICDVS